MCPYMGTLYCMELCTAWVGIPIEGCSLECGECEESKRCPCTKYALPREIVLAGVVLFLTNPNAPQKLNTMSFQEVYGYPPSFLRYIEEWGVFVMGPCRK